MAKAFVSVVLTAHDLIEGDSLFLSPEGWHPEIARAMVAVTEDQADELRALGDRHSRDNGIFGAYLVAITTDSGAPVPVARRERIRAAGAPTIPVGTEALAALDRRAA